MVLKKIDALVKKKKPKKKINWFKLLPSLLCGIGFTVLYISQTVYFAIETGFSDDVIYYLGALGLYFLGIRIYEVMYDRSTINS